MRGDRLKQLRENVRLSQEELADQIGISEPQIWRYEKGESSPRADILTKLSSYFGVSADYILGISDNPVISLSGELSPKETAVISAWRHGDRSTAIKVIANDET